MSAYLKPQPPPLPGAATPTWEEVVAHMDQQATQALPEDAPVWCLLADDGRARDAEGRRKYSQPHQHDNGRDHAADAYQENLDSCCYWWAEWRKTKHLHALGMYDKAVELSFLARQYLFRRDGR